MINRIQLRAKLKNFLPKIKAPKDIFELFRLLNYPKDCFFDPTYKRRIDEFEFKVNDRKKIKNIYTILKLREYVRIFLIEVETLSSELTKYLAKIFSERYDSILLVITKDYINFLFVLPDYERGPKGKPRLKITKLYIEREEPYYTARNLIEYSIRR